MTAQLQPGKLVTLRGREWVVLPSDDPDNLLIVKPLGGSDEEITGIYLPLDIRADRPVDARFSPPTSADLGDISTARLLYDSARLAFRNGAGPFRALAKLSFRPRAYQIVPLIMALRQDTVRLLIADDVGVGKTIEALLIVRELLERRTIKRFAVVCLPHLCEQWQEEIRSKLDIEAVIIRSNTQARLDRQIQGDASVYDYYPFQIISIDFIKSDVRRDVFVEQCPELVIVDETHTCARPTGASAAQQQRYHLISRIAAKPGQHLVMLTATPHSGKPEEFQSLLGLLKPEFEPLDLPSASQAQRRDLARHFIQRKRAHVEKWMGEDTPFPTRDPFEWPYDLSREYADFFNDIIDFARKLVVPDSSGKRKKRVQYWTALALLRGVMSSPDAGVKMLNTRLDRLAEATPDSDATVSEAAESENPVRDLDYGFEGDNAPTQVLEQGDWSEHQRRQLKTFAERLEKLGNIQYDGKLFAAAIVLEEWLEKGFNTVVFCRYIETAKYLGAHLGPALRKKYPKLDLQVVTSEDPDDVRRDRIEKMSGDKPRVLIATDCLSEGINLQEGFTAVLHYDLPWNPNRLEQREGRVDRFGQKAPEVKACLLYGADNPIDGIVLDVLLRKVREIKRATGINVPFPEDSQSIIDTITQALLLNPDRRIEKKRGEKQQLIFDFTEFSEAAAAKAKVTRKVDEAADRETASRSIFAQYAIKAQEIEEDLRAVDEAIGDPKAVQDFVTSALSNLLGVQVIKEREGFGIVPGNLPPQLVDLLPVVKPSGTKLIKISFESPTPEGYHYLGRNHRFVEQLCQFVMANTLARQDKRAARTAVIRTQGRGEGPGAGSEIDQQPVGRHAFQAAQEHGHVRLAIDVEVGHRQRRHAACRCYRQGCLERAIAVAEEDFRARGGCAGDGHHHVGFAVVIKVRGGDEARDAAGGHVVKRRTERAVADSRENVQLAGYLHHQIGNAIAIEIGRHLAIVVGVDGGQSADETEWRAGERAAAAPEENRDRRPGERAGGSSGPAVERPQQTVGGAPAHRRRTVPGSDRLRRGEAGRSEL